MTEPTTPAPESPPSRRTAIVAGAGLLALAGFGAGAATLLGQQPTPNSQPPVSDPTGGAPLRLNRPIAAPTVEATTAAPTPTPTPTPSVAVEVPVTVVEDPETSTAEAAQPTQVPATEADSEPVRVLQDPMDPEMVEEEDPATPDSNDEFAAGPAQIDPSEAYLAAPPDATLRGTNPNAPGLKLETTPAWHLARRAGLSSSTVIAAEIESMGTTAWIDYQLAPEKIDDSFVDGLISQHFRWSTAPLTSVFKETRQTWRVAHQLTNALLARSRFTRRVLAENVYDVLANHVYAPSIGKAPQFSGEYDALIRTHGLGRYADLLHALMTHPAMLIELDNHVNTKDNPNENLGRELLELYTVGVGNYTEDDVRHSALLLTGHGLDWRTLAYTYREANHHLGALEIMDFSDGNAASGQGPQLLKSYLDHLAVHPATAQRLAHRFAVRFISDEPKQSTVDELAKVYLDSDTSIAALVRATLLHPDFEASAGQKWRRPGDVVMSIARASQVVNVSPRGTVGSGREGDTGLLGWLISTGKDMPRQWPVVNGYPDTASYWNSASITLPMLNATQAAVSGDKRESGETNWAVAMSVNPGDNAVATAERLTWHLTGYRWPSDLVLAIAGLLMGDTAADPSSTLPTEKLDYWVSQAVRVIFASPYGFCK